MPNEDEAPFKIHLTFLREKFTFLINLLVLDVAQHRECCPKEEPLALLRSPCRSDCIPKEWKLRITTRNPGAKLILYNRAWPQVDFLNQADKKTT